MEAQNVVFDNSTKSNSILIDSSRFAALYLPSGFAGSAVGVEAFDDDDGWVPIGDGSASISESVEAGKVNLLTENLFAATSRTIRFSATSQTITGKLYLSR